MSDQPFAFNEQSARRIADAVRRVEEQLPALPTTKRRVYGAGAGVTKQGGTGGGGCCCDEADCLSRPDAVPAYYLLSTGEFCSCEQTEIKLYPVAESTTIYESDLVQCVAPAGLTIPCTREQEWRWRTATSTWEAVPADDAGCSCEPPEPDFSGTTEDQQAFTSCESTKVSDGQTDLVDSFWRLTISEVPTAYGCDSSKLEWIFNLDPEPDHVAIEYKLNVPCGGRGFCRRCTNSFRITSCRETWCDLRPPSVVCLQAPSGWVPVPPGWQCCTPQIVNGEPQLPRFLTFTIPVDGQTIGANNLAVQTCCERIAGTYVLEWNDVDAWEYYFFRGVLTPEEAIAQACGTSGSPGTFPCVGMDRRVLWKWQLGCGFGATHLVLKTCPNCFAASLPGECEAWDASGVNASLGGATNDKITTGPPFVNDCFQATEGLDGTRYLWQATHFMCTISPVLPAPIPIIITPVI